MLLFCGVHLGSMHIFLYNVSCNIQDSLSQACPAGGLWATCSPQVVNSQPMSFSLTTTPPQLCGQQLWSPGSPAILQLLASALAPGGNAVKWEGTVVLVPYIQWGFPCCVLKVGCLYNICSGEGAGAAVHVARDWMVFIAKGEGTMHVSGWERRPGCACSSGSWFPHTGGHSWAACITEGCSAGWLLQHMASRAAVCTEVRQLCSITSTVSELCLS